MTDITLTEARSTEDIDAVRTLCWAYRDFLLTNSEVDRQITETFYPEPTYTALMAELPKLHARPKGIMLLARDAAGSALGCGMSHALNTETSEIKRVFVAPAGRGKGIARQICTALVDRARADGFARVVLDTSRQLLAAQALYTGLGFHPRGPYQDIPPDVLPDLKFFERAL